MVFNKESDKIRKKAQERKYLPSDEESEDPTYDVLSFVNSGISSLDFPPGKKEITIPKLLEFAKTLSTVMPKISDESLFEIDDILYENYEVSQVREYFCSSKSKFLDYVDIETYSKFYRSIIDKGLFDHELDTFYLRLAENIGGIHFDWIFRILAYSRDERKICLCLKILKSCLKADGLALDIIKDFADELDVSFFLIRLQKMTVPSDSKMKRIAEFIIKQAGACLEDIKKDVKEDVNMLKEPKRFIECSMLNFDYQSWHNYHWTPNYQYALFDVFMSAKDMNERKEFLKAFVKTLHAFSYGNGSINQGFGMILNSISDNLLSIARYIVERACCEEEMRSINQHYDYKVEPYWSECVDESLRDAKDQMVVKYVEATDEHFFKKFLVYDDFMKCLHLMSIIHDAFTKYEVLYEDDKVFERKKGFLSHKDKPDFYSSKPCFKMYESTKLYSDLKNKKVSWPLEMAVTKCPFLYLKPNACHLGKEYLKHLKGEHIDEDVHKEIFGYSSYPLV